MVCQISVHGESIDLPEKKNRTEKKNSSEKKNIVFMDVETQHIMQEFKGGWNRIENYNKLKVAVAGLKYHNVNECLLYEENDVHKMIGELESADIIVGHNLINFDYPVIRRYTNSDVINRLKIKTFDTWQELYKITGRMIALDDLSKCNCGICKNEQGIIIPKMWREGKHSEVKEYLINDLKMIEAIYNHGKNVGSFKFYDGKMTVNVKW